MENINESIIDEAKKCLNCKNPMCRKGCPINTNIPEFISEIKENNLKRAYEILSENNFMSYICSTVCPYEETCEGNCIRGIKGESVKIHKLEKYVNSWARENNVTYKYTIEESKNTKIAIIGSGPSGIACAVELAKKGYDITIYEKENFVGGLLSYGIPGFRLPRNISNVLEDNLENLNINIEKNKEFGKNITINSLKKEGYKAIFIGIGNEISTKYSLTETKCDKIYTADYILREYNAKRIVKDLGNVIVIGGGNVATDSARAAQRMGAKSTTIIYRRSHNKMPAREIELNEAINDGVKIIYNTKVLKAETNKGKIKIVKCIKTKEIDNSLQEISNTEFDVEADSVIFAIGLKPNKELLETEGLLLENGLLITNEKNETNIEGVFAGGDVMQNKATVCRAILEGKKAAKAIENYLK